MRTTIILLTIFFCISCNSNKNSLPTVIDLDNVENVKLSEIVDSIKMVQLETTPECLMQSASEIFIYNDRFYIFDGKQYVVFCFDKEGKFLFKINNRGRGPKEYSYICDIELDKINNRLLLLEPWGNIFYFTLQGEFISKLKLPNEVKAYNNVFTIGKDTLLFPSLSDNIIIYLEKENKILSKIPFKYGEEISFSGNYIYKYNDELYHIDGVTLRTDRIYANGNMSYIRDLDIGKYNLDSSKALQYEELYKDAKKKIKTRIETMMQDLAEVADKLPKYTLCNILEYDRYVLTYFYSMYNQLFRIAIIDKKLNTSKVTDIFIDDVFFHNYLGTNNYTKDNILILAQNDNRFKGQEKYYNPDLLDAKNKAIADAHTDDMNPMLALYYLKK